MAERRDMKRVRKQRQGRRVDEMPEISVEDGERGRKVKEERWRPWRVEGRE